MIPPPLTPAEIRREVRRQLRKRGCDGYRDWTYAHGEYDGPVCADGCGRIASQHGRRCMKCSEDCREAAKVRRANKRKAAT